jgi:hypothetical protein
MSASVRSQPHGNRRKPPLLPSGVKSAFATERQDHQPCQCSASRSLYRCVAIVVIAQHLATIAAIGMARLH